MTQDELQAIVAAVKASATDLNSLTTVTALSDGLASLPSYDTAQQKMVLVPLSLLTEPIAAAAEKLTNKVQMLAGIIDTKDSLPSKVSTSESPAAYFCLADATVYILTAAASGTDTATAKADKTVIYIDKATDKAYRYRSEQAVLDPADQLAELCAADLTAYVTQTALAQTLAAYASLKSQQTLEAKVQELEARVASLENA